MKTMLAAYLPGNSTVDLREVKAENFIRLGNGWQLRAICDDF